MNTFPTFIVIFIFLVITLLKEDENKIEESNKTEISQERMKNVFTMIYKNHSWGRGSGPGSYRECTVEYLAFLKNFISSHNIKTITDLGCGDWQMMKYYSFTKENIYYGYDVVKDVIETDKILYGSNNINFYFLEDIFKMKISDLLIVKDVLIHWKNDIVIDFLKKIVIKYRYVILVNDFFRRKTNKDIEIGQFRAIDLEIDPFNYKKFTKYIDMLFCNKMKRIYIIENDNI